MKLFCFPYAGGNSAVFRAWAQALRSVEVNAVELPGRRRRLREPLCRRISDLVRDLIPVFTAACEGPYAVFGHSLGAIVAYEMVRAIGQASLRPPELLIVSAAAAPHLPRRFPALHTLPKPELLRFVAAMGGTSVAGLNNEEVVDLVLPMLRADFEMFATYEYRPSTRLTCPVIGLSGSNDPVVSTPSVEAWQHHADVFRAVTMKGGHFFLRSAQGQLLKLIDREVRALDEIGVLEGARSG